MNEEITAGLWCRLESFLMTKSLSNKFFMKNQWRKGHLSYSVSWATTSPK